MGRMRIGRLVVSLIWITAAFGKDLVLPEGDAKKIVQSSCTSCHTLEVLEGRQWTKARWQAVVGNMVERGAAINKEDSASVIEYLAKNFGEDRGKGLVEDICSLCHEWQRVKDYPMTREQWAGTIKGMIFEGAPVTDEEFKLIVDYLAKNFGPPKD
jgi:cytochrome c5